MGEADHDCSVPSVLASGSLQESIRQWVIGALPYDRADHEAVTYLRGLDAHGLLVLYHNWMNRRVRPLPRQIRKSKAFLQNPVVSQRAADFAQIAADIERGNNLRKYLSRDIDVAFTPPGKPFKRRRDLDLMLNDWGVYHLHISNRVEADGFVARDEPLLFAAFKPQTAYFIDVLRHGDWTRDHVLEVLASEWPDEGIIYRLNGLNPELNLSDEQRKVLRNKYGNAPFSYEGKVYIPAGMMSAGTGTTYWATLEASKLLEQAKAFEMKLTNYPDWTNSPDEPQFKFEMQNDGYVFGAIKRHLHAKMVVQSPQWWRV